jgi:hypothetical protein
MLYFLIHADVALQLLGQGDHWALNEHRPLHNTMPIQVSQNMQDKTEVQTGYHKRLPLLSLQNEICSWKSWTALTVGTP